MGTKQDALRLGFDDPCALKSDGAHIRLELRDGQWEQWEYCKNQPDVIGSEGTYTSTDKDLVLHEPGYGDGNWPGRSTANRLLSRSENRKATSRVFDSSSNDS